MTASRVGKVLVVPVVATVVALALAACDKRPAPSRTTSFDGAPAKGPFMPRLHDPARQGFLARVAGWEAALERGEPADAYKLFNHLDYCAQMPEMLRHHERQCLNAGTCDQRALGNARDWTGECSSIAPQRLARRFHYLDLAASRGDVRAQSQFSRHPPPGMEDAHWRERHPREVQEFDRRAHRYLEAAAERGALNAIASLASNYQEGRHVPADPVRAYAYFLAYLALRPELGNEEAARSHYGRGLDEAQQLRARTLADEIVRRCCR
jgi:hypothetical protein